jgi:acyl-CoA synthetase (NDP forming)
MINQALVNPKSIVVVGGSDNTGKPGGKVLKNILEGGFAGRLLVVNQKETTVQGLECLQSVDAIDSVELAIISIPAEHCPGVVRTLANEKGTRAFIILSAGFGEAGEQGKRWEREIVQTVDAVGGCLIGPNCIGILNAHYHGVFTTPIPPYDPMGCDLVSSSGATAVFLIEAGIPSGLRFANVFSVGNGAQTGIEEVVEYLDLTYDPETDSRIKLLYLESVSNPQKLLRHASSLVRKGVRIAAIKAGCTVAGSRAAASHTGALMTSDLVIRALFKKAGIVYCSSREELLSVASVFHYKALKGKNIAVITHAGGSAVMLTDALTLGGLQVPAIAGPDAEQLLSSLHPGSSVANPIDFLATGTAEQLGLIIDYCEHKFDQVDAMVVVFGSPGLFDVANVYAVISEKLAVCSKPIYPVLPSVINAQKEIREFLASGHVNFPDEVELGRALVAIDRTPAPQLTEPASFTLDDRRIRSVVDAVPDGFLSPAQVEALLDAAGIPRVHERFLTGLEDIGAVSRDIGFPLAMKVVGPVHKTDVGGVLLNIKSVEEMQTRFSQLMDIEGAGGVLVQPMIEGIELFVGVKRESNFGHLVLCGLGGIYVEVLNDFSSCLCPVSSAESLTMIRNLKACKVIRGTRGRAGVDEDLFGEIIRRVSALVAVAPEIAEMDINPLMGAGRRITAVDTRIRIGR